MRINNKRVIPFVNIVYTFLFLGILCGILLILIPIPALVILAGPELKPLFPYLIVIIFAVMIVIFKKTGPQQFEYSSDGETITIKTRDPFWFKYFPQNQRMVDFPKRKLTGFRIGNKIFGKNLELFLKSNRNQGATSRVILNIRYLNKKEVSDLKRSLNRIIQKNKETDLDNKTETGNNERSE